MQPKSCRRGEWQKRGKLGGSVGCVQDPGHPPPQAGGRAWGSSHLPEPSPCLQYRSFGGGNPFPDSGQEGGPPTAGHLRTAGFGQPQPTPGSGWLLCPRACLDFDFIFTISSLTFSFSAFFSPLFFPSVSPASPFSSPSPFVSFCVFFPLCFFLCLSLILVSLP